MDSNTTFVGLDVHKKSINIAVIPAGSSKVTEQWKLENEPRSLRRLAKHLKERYSGSVQAVYEAGPCGYGFLHQMTELGIDCRVIAPSLIPKKPGEHIKTDRRDAANLAAMFRAGLLTEVRPPSPEEEAVRDLTRAREDSKKDLLSARHRLSKMLLRHGIVYREGKNWTTKHRSWLKGVRFEAAPAQQVFDNYLLAIEQIEERIKALESHVEKVAKSEAYAEKVGWLRCLRGVDTVTAMIILAELHGFNRFKSARELMSYLGLTPSEYSSSERKRKGGITKAGNGHVRRALVESAWSYRHRPAVKGELKKRREGQPAAVLAIADRAQQRLHSRYFKLKEGYCKPHNVAVVAVARELVGFIWAVLNHRYAA
jgi:transposase